MPVETKKNSAWWYGRYTLDGTRSKLKNTGVKVGGAKGSKPFDISKGKAEQVVADWIEKARVPKAETDMLTAIYESKTSRKFESIPLADITGEWDAYPSKRTRSDQYTAQVHGFVAKLVAWLAEQHPKAKCMADVSETMCIGFHVIAVEVPDTVADTVNSTNEPLFWIDGQLLTRSELPATDQHKAAARKQIAAARYGDETGGLTLPTGMFVRTDTRTRLALTAAMIKASGDPAFIFPNWKLDNGTFVDLDAGTLATIYGAVMDHIAKAYEKEKLLTDSIEAATTVGAVNAVQW